MSGKTCRGSRERLSGCALAIGTAREVLWTGRSIGAVALAVAAATMVGSTAPAAASQAGHRGPAGYHVWASSGSRAHLSSHRANTARGGTLPAEHHRRHSWAYIATGISHTCSISLKHTLWCWGNNGFGQLGIGSYIGHSLPHEITTPARSGWTSVAAGGFLTCATRTHQTLWCWGGFPGTTYPSLPQQVTTPAPTGWARIAAGGGYACGIRTSGTLWCWGGNSNGQLGIGNTTDLSLPHQVTTPAAAGWTSVAAGEAHTCATRTDGTLWCWGYNERGQLGIGNTTDQSLPHQVTTPAPAGWTSVTPGGAFTCATRIQRALWCWGDDSIGQLGIGSYNYAPQSLPQQVTAPAAAGWTSIGAGFAHACAVRATSGHHTLWCWGRDVEGQLGIGNTTDQDLPQQVTAPTRTGWASITGGERYTCATRVNGSAWCWGDDNDGQLGIGSHIAHNLPQQVKQPPRHH